jgi:hypothetical protein
MEVEVEIPGTLKYRAARACYFYAGADLESTLTVPSNIFCRSATRRRQTFPHPDIFTTPAWVSRGFDRGHSLDGDLYLGCTPKRVARWRTWPTIARLERIPRIYRRCVFWPSMREPTLCRGISLPACLLALTGPPGGRFSRRPRTWSATRTLRQLSTADRHIPHSRRLCPLLRHPSGASCLNMVAFRSPIPRRGISSRAPPLSVTYLTSNTVSLQFNYVA